MATAADVPGVTDAIASAFHDDPLWSWVFPDPQRRAAQFAVWWRFFVQAAVRYPWVQVTEGCEAAAVWIPPGGTELPPEEEPRVEPLLAELVGSRVDQVLDLLNRFEAARPRDRQHFYLSLFATHTQHRGRGLGMGLLAENLRLIDAEAMPAYLESSNPANMARYQSVGFEATGSFTAPGGGPAVTTMWREAKEC